jgi:hypothetical protein
VSSHGFRRVAGERFRLGPLPLAGAAPHAIEAEQCLLGAIFINNDALIKIVSRVDAEDFFEPVHQNIFEICSGLIGDGKVASLRSAPPRRLEDTRVSQVGLARNAIGDIELVLQRPDLTSDRIDL